eukprot:365596-Chlamydomonas_euryale.AAC.31
MKSLKEKWNLDSSQCTGLDTCRLSRATLTTRADGADDDIATMTGCCSEGGAVWKREGSSTRRSACARQTGEARATVVLVCAVDVAAAVRCGEGAPVGAPGYGGGVCGPVTATLPSHQEKVHLNAHVSFSHVACPLRQPSVQIPPHPPRSYLRAFCVRHAEHSASEAENAARRLRLPSSCGVRARGAGRLSVKAAEVGRFAYHSSAVRSLGALLIDRASTSCGGATRPWLAVQAHTPGRAADKPASGAFSQAAFTRGAAAGTGSRGHKFQRRSLAVARVERGQD